MKILRNREYTRRITEAANRAWVDGFNCAREHPYNDWQRELERGRITLNEYRRLAYDLPPIEVNNERLSK